MEKEVKILTDDRGNRSSMRLLNFIIIITILMVWIIICFKKSEFVSFHESHVWLIAVSMFGKVLQKGVEADFFTSILKK